MSRCWRCDRCDAVKPITEMTNRVHTGKMDMRDAFVRGTHFDEYPPKEYDLCDDCYQVVMSAIGVEPPTPTHGEQG